MFPWSDTCLFKRLKRQRRLSQKEEEILDFWETDVCSGGELPEVEIVSLLEEQIPKYKLRADTLTEFTGYENQDWFIPCPALKPEDADVSALSPDTIRETLNYFLLCSNRVSQMTKTYNDIEAVTRLLEEKEKDIELTARIGKELLSNNQKLENTVANLECELRSANEKITQLQHELVKKTELIQILTNDVEESGCEEVAAPIGAVNMDMLQRRIGKLEEENVQLRSEASFLAEQTDEVEQEEQRLVSDFISQLSSARSELSAITDEAEKYREESRVFKRLSDNLQEKLQQNELKLSKSKTDNEEITALLLVTKETQNELALELCDLKERYAEVLGLLQETQDALKTQKNKGVPTVRGGGLFSSMNSSTLSSHHPDSLGTELECSLMSELSLDSGISSDRVSHYKKVFDTVRSVSKNSSMGSISPAQGNSYHVQPTYDSSSSIMSFGSHNVVRRGARFTTSSSQRLSYTSDDFSASDSEYSDDSAYPGGPREGIPGAPGSADLAEALRRLTPAAVNARRAALSSGAFMGAAVYDSECRTPDSIMSTSSYSGGDMFSNIHWKLPDKLQIVKPIEGSQTLHQWSQLATPSLGGLLDERPGIKTRGGAKLEDLGLHLYSLCDVEEDEEIVHPGKSFQNSGCVYTYTTTKIMHPGDGTSLSSSMHGSRMSTVSNSRESTTPSTPARLSRRNSTCTFSTTLGLAKVLNERGIIAATPSKLVTPSFTATATPSNSPDGGNSPTSTPLHSRSASPSMAPFSSAFGFPGLLVSSGAEYLRRTLTGGIFDSVPHTSRSRESRNDGVVAKTTDKKAIRLVETVEKLGLETLISSTTSNEETADANEGSGGSGRSLRSKLLSRRGADGKSNSSSNSKARSVARAVRPDLGTVLGSVPSVPVTKESAPSQQNTTLGTLSSLLFGRKGGLL